MRQIYGLYGDSLMMWWVARLESLSQARDKVGSRPIGEFRGYVVGREGGQMGLCGRRCDRRG